MAIFKKIVIKSFVSELKLSKKVLGLQNINVNFNSLDGYGI